MSEAELSPSRDRYIELATGVTPRARIPIEQRVQVSDPFQAYRNARGEGDGVFLETTGGQAGWGYFAVDPVERITASLDAETWRESASPSLAAISGVLEGETLIRGECEVPYPCGLFGWISYDLARELEDIPETTRDDRGLPHLQFGLFDRVAAWREPREGEEVTVHLVSCPRVGNNPEQAYDLGRKRIADLRSAIQTEHSEDGGTKHPTDSATFTSECGREAYANRVKQIKRYIRDGDTFQVNVSHRLSADAPVPSIDVYNALRKVNPAPYSGILEFREFDLVSASPELLLAVDGNNLFTEPIAGTRPRGDSPEADEDLEAELADDEKERAEHAMLVDLERNDLGKVSQFGSVQVREYRRVDRYSEVMHLVSLIEGRLREDVTLTGVSQANPLHSGNTTASDRLCAAIAAMFPGGTITGAPKPRTMEIIDELETTRRGPYTGSMGIIGFDQRATLNIIIRTIVRHRGSFYLRVGAGIVHDSIPDREYEETMDKARALITAMNDALSEGTELEVA